MACPGYNNATTEPIVAVAWPTNRFSEGRALEAQSATEVAAVIFELQLEPAHRADALHRRRREDGDVGFLDAGKLLLPIPYSQILIDPNLIQNPGYSSN